MTKEKLEQPTVELYVAERYDRPIMQKELRAVFALAAKEQENPYKDCFVPSDKLIGEVFHKDASNVLRVWHDGRCVGGAVSIFHRLTGYNEIAAFYILPEYRNQGFGKAAWKAMELLYPKAQIWTLAVPYFEKNCLHFYINHCGFQAVELYNSRHPEEYPGAGMAVAEAFGEPTVFQLQKIMPKPAAKTETERTAK